MYIDMHHMGSINFFGLLLARFSTVNVSQNHPFSILTPCYFSDKKDINARRIISKVRPYFLNNTESYVKCIESKGHQRIKKLQFIYVLSRLCFRQCMFVCLQNILKSC